MPRLGMTPPMVEIMAPLPVLSMAGCVLAADPSGTARYIYGLFPTSNIAATFWRYDTSFNAWEQMATPTFAADELLLTTCAMVADGTPPNNVYLFNSRAIVGPPVTAYHRLQWYNATTDTWTQLAPAAPNDLETIAGLVAAWASDAALCHPCTSVGFPASDAFIYLCGNASADMPIYDITNNIWIASAGAARAAVCGAGVGAVWLPESPNLIFSPRGGNASDIDVYTISTGAFAAGPTQIPALLRTTGTETIADVHRSRVLTQLGGRMYEAAVTYTGGAGGYLGIHTPLGTFYKADGTLHKGNGLVAARSGGQSYVYWRKHTSLEFQRMEVLE